MHMCVKFEEMVTNRVLLEKPAKNALKSTPPADGLPPQLAEASTKRSPDHQDYQGAYVVCSLVGTDYLGDYVCTQHLFLRILFVRSFGGVLRQSLLAV
jgi:hypothetical protein